MFTYLDEVALGLPITEIDEAAERIRLVDFEKAAVWISTVELLTDEAENTMPDQLAAVDAVFTDPELVHRLRLALKSRPRDIVFAGQLMSALCRSAVVHAGSGGAPGNLDSFECAVMERSYFAMSSTTVARAERKSWAAPTEFDPIALMVQHAAFYATEPLLNTMSRVARLLDEVAVSAAARDHPEFCDINAWLTEDSGMSCREQMALGLEALAVSKAIDGSAPVAGRGRLGQKWAADVGSRLNVPESSVREALSADREWYRSRYLDLERSLKLNPTQVAAGWVRSPLEDRPFLRLHAGDWMLWSPRYVTGWAAAGVLSRAAEHAYRNGFGRRFANFMGWVVERYVVELARSTWTPKPFVGAGIAHGDHEYQTRSGAKRTPDVALDFGQDLVLIEVFAGKLTAASRITASPAKVRADLRRMVTAKAKQLSRRIDDFRSGRFSYPGVDRRDVRRIWPVVVTGSGLPMNELVWTVIDDELTSHFTQPEVEHPEVLDLADFEQLCGLAEAGWAVPDLLRRKAGAYRQLEFRRMIFDDPHIPSDLNSSQIRAGADAVFKHAIADLKIRPDLPRPENP